MRNNIFYLAVFASLGFLACEPDDNDFGDNIPDWNQNIGAYTTVEVDAENSFYNFLNPLENEDVVFTIDVEDFDVTDVESVDVELVYTAIGRLPNPDPAGAPLDQVFDPIIWTSSTSFPFTVTLNAQDVADRLGVDLDSFRIGDNFRTTFPINTADGRRLTTALNSDLCQQPAQPSFGGCNVDWSISCPSTLGGTVVDYQVLEAIDADGNAIANASGSFTWIASGPTTFQWDSYTFGVYQSAFGCCERAGADLTIFDVCNELSISPADGFGCGWNLNVDSVDGSVLVLTLTGGCFTSITVEMTRVDGSDWPPLF